MIYGNCGVKKMYDFLANAKLFLRIREEMGVLDADTNKIYISVDRIKALSKFFSVRVKLGYDKDTELNYFYFLTIDGVNFVASSNWEEARENGLVEIQFKEGAEVWG